jgi:uncharacterized heparinase superfamily protein
MKRVSIAERARISVFIGRRFLRSLIGIIRAHPLTRWRYGSATTDRLLIAPQDLRTADATRASEIYGGRFAFAGKVVICDRRSPFEMAPPSDEWAVDLLTFIWLRHLRADTGRVGVRIVAAARNSNAGEEAETAGDDGERRH